MLSRILIHLHHLHFSHFPTVYATDALSLGMHRQHHGIGFGFVHAKKRINTSTTKSIGVKSSFNNTT